MRDAVRCREAVPGLLRFIRPTGSEETRERGRGVSSLKTWVDDPVRVGGDMLHARRRRWSLWLLCLWLPRWRQRSPCRRCNLLHPRVAVEAIIHPLPVCQVVDGGNPRRLRVGTSVPPRRDHVDMEVVVRRRALAVALCNRQSLHPVSEGQRGHLPVRGDGDGERICPDEVVDGESAVYKPPRRPRVVEHRHQESVVAQVHAHRRVQQDLFSRQAPDHFDFCRARVATDSVKGRDVDDIPEPTAPHVEDVGIWSVGNDVDPVEDVCHADARVQTQPELHGVPGHVDVDPPREVPEVPEGPGMRGRSDFDLPSLCIDEQWHIHVGKWRWSWFQLEQARM